MKPGVREASTSACKGPSRGRHTRRDGKPWLGALVLALAALGGCASDVERQVPLLYAPVMDRVAPPSLLPDAQKTARVGGRAGGPADKPAAG